MPLVIVMPVSGPAVFAAPSLAALLTAAVALVLPGHAHAAHPVLTEDAGTQGAGRFELELGFQRTRDDGGRGFEFGPQFSWGVRDDLDVIVRPTWLDLSGDGTTSRGIGDTSLDGKWRFHEQGPFALGIRAGINVPTGSAARGLGAGHAGFHGVLIVSWTGNALAFYANAGAIHVGSVPLERRDLALVSVAVVWTVHQRLRLSAEIGTASNPDPERGTWPAVARFGAMVTVTPWLDVDAGYQTRRNHAAPEQTILAGATLRW
ncbi:MAG: transporter [Aromatoleum sp.]|nr:transporter [Aromatoleum sp.]